MLKIWDKKTNIIFPNGQELTPAQVMSHATHGWTKHAETVIEQHGSITVAIDNLATLLAVNGLDESLTGQTALDAITAARAKQAEDAQQANALGGIDPNIVAALVATFNMQQQATKDAITTGIVTAMETMQDGKINETEVLKAIDAAFTADHV